MDESRRKDLYSTVQTAIGSVLWDIDRYTTPIVHLSDGFSTVEDQKAEWKRRVEVCLRQKTRLQEIQILIYNPNVAESEIINQFHECCSWSDWISW